MLVVQNSFQKLFSSCLYMMVLMCAADGKWVFEFSVKFYPPEPSILQEEITRLVHNLQNLPICRYIVTTVEDIFVYICPEVDRCGQNLAVGWGGERVILQNFQQDHSRGPREGSRKLLFFCQEYHLPVWSLLLCRCSQISARTCRFRRS